MKIIEKPQTVLLPDVWLEGATRSFKIQRYLRELELPKTDLVTNFSGPENWNFENVTVVTFK